MISMDVDVALSEVPVNLVALTSDTDFKTIDETIAFNESGMELIWHFVTSAGAYSATAVTPTSGGVYDWAHQDGGMYTIEIPASGGASINNTEEGYGWFTGKADGVLPWRGPTICFRAAAINDSLCDAGATGLLSPTTAGRTLDVTAANKVQGVVLVDTLTTYTGNTPQTADHTADIAAIKAKTDNLPTDPADASVISGRFDTLDTSIADLPTNAELATALGTADDAILAQVALVKAKTDNLPSDPADQSLVISATDALATLIGDVPTNAELATALAAADDAVLAAIAALNNVSTANILAMAYEGAETFQDFLRLARAALVGKSDGFPAMPAHFRDKADAKNRITVTADSDGNRTAISTDAT